MNKVSVSWTEEGAGDQREGAGGEGVRLRGDGGRASGRRSSGRVACGLKVGRPGGLGPGTGGGLGEDPDSAALDRHSEQETGGELERRTGTPRGDPVQAGEAERLGGQWGVGMKAWAGLPGGCRERYPEAAPLGAGASRQEVGLQRCPRVQIGHKLIEFHAASEVGRPQHCDPVDA